MYKYKKIGLGGTFDHFHKGHQAFLLFASQLAQHLVIGITTPEMITHKKFSSQIQEYEMRADAVKSFTKNFFNTVDVIPLTDPYGPTLLGSNVEALAATTATQSGAEAVNKKRESL
ncbi:MAG: pantetheine-phosphate adenylyltransferase, partial [Patescibacteria group bacterium]|nr:pantetheine-phosphate adenylyltransferase [Patescibacteria group bacterium]